MNEFTRIPRSPEGENERSRRGLPIALTIIILIVGGMGIIKFQSNKQSQRPSAPLEDFVPGIWEEKLELFIQPRDRPEEPLRIEFDFEYTAAPSYGGNETIAKRLKVFEREAKTFLGPMRRQDLTSPKAKAMIQPALFEVLERSLFPRARGRLTEFHVRKIHDN
jgi:hypothetical protein